ncbi:MAG: AzlD domain-containing protein [Lachnospiraceae bacterium]|nr:AzlD domain-containing protein [Lachnospiraceae bacterium]
MKHNIYIYILVMFLVSYGLRALPLTLIRKEIKNRTIRSFLYYVPYVTLAVMTFPAIMDSTGAPLAGLLALVIGMVAAWFGAGLFPTAIICSLVVFFAELFLHV